MQEHHKSFGKWGFKIIKIKYCACHFNGKLGTSLRFYIKSVINGIKQCLLIQHGVAIKITAGIAGSETKHLPRTAAD